MPIRILQLLRVLKIGLGGLWALGLLVFGFGVLMNVEGLLARMLGVGAIAGGEFVLMWMVADDVCPKAPVGARGMMKLTSAFVFWMCVIVGCWYVARMMIDGRV